MKRTKVIDALKRTDFGADICVKGWVRSKRGSKGIFFIALNDGSTIKNVQIVGDDAMVKNPPALKEPRVLSLRQKEPLEKGLAAHSSQSCLENSMDRGAWRATVHGVTKSLI